MSKKPKMTMPQRKLLCSFLFGKMSVSPWTIKDAARLEAAAKLLSIELSSDQRHNVDLVLGVIKNSKAPKPKRVVVAANTYRPSQSEIATFYDSWEWKRLSYRCKQENGRRCRCCGARPEDGAVIHTDHVKPIRFFWHLRLDPTNLQILCESCNRGKGSWDQTDFRVTAA